MKQKPLHPFRLCALLLLLATASCGGSDDLLPQPPGDDGSPLPVGFSASVVAPADTRASGELTTANITSMGVFAYYTGQSNWSTTNIPNFMWNEYVGRTNSSSPWTYDPVKYWPNTAGDKITFFAYAPHTDDVRGLSVNTTATDTGYPELYYEFDSSDPIDLLAAAALKDRTKSASSQAFAMKHVMTRVLVNVKCPDAIKVTYIGLTGLPANYGTLTWNDSGNPVWKDLGGSLSASCNTPTDVSADVTTQVAEFFLPPATPTAGSLDITFSLNGSTETKNVDIPSSPAWTPGQAVAYTLNIEVGSEITLSVKAWERNDANGTVGEEVPTTGYPFARNGIVYVSPTKAYYVGPDYYYDVTGDGWGQAVGETTGWYQWDPAIRICRGYHSTAMYGASQWRLPTIDELELGRSYGLVGGSTYWSTTMNTDPRFPDSPWALSGGNKKGDMSKSNGCRLLCVRDVGSEMVYPTARSVNDIPVIYLSSSKSYMVYGSSEVRTQSDAISYCSGLSYGGYSGWRLPTYEEATWVLNLGVKPGTTYWTSQTNQAIAGSYKSLSGSGGGWFDDAPAGVAKARTYCVHDY